MKIKRLKTIHFLVVCILILILPVLKEWDMVLNGDRVEGVVIETRKEVTGKESLIRGIEYRSIIRYQYKNKVYTIAGPENLVYETGKKVPLIVHPDKGGEVMIASLTGFYIHRRSIALIIVLILWIAIFTTIVQVQRGTTYSRK